MPRKKKPAKSTAQLLDEAMRDLADAQKRVEHYRERLAPLHQTLIAEMAALGSPAERPYDRLRVDSQIEETLEFEAPASDRQRLA